MKRKVAGLTMNVSKVYNDKHVFTHTEYTFINPVTTQVLNYTIFVLAEKYNTVKADKITDDLTETDYGTIDTHTGTILCYDREQYAKYCKEKYNI